MWYYQSKKDDTEVIDKLSELVEQYPTRGFDEYYHKITCMEQKKSSTRLSLNETKSKKKT